MTVSITRVVSLAAFVAAIACATPRQARANEICAAEFGPIMQRHQEVMQETRRSMATTRPRDFQTARANAQRACGALGNAQASFQRLQSWVSANAEFCQLPEQMVRDVRTGLVNVTRNRRNACNAVGQLDRQRAQAEAQGGAGGNPFGAQPGRRPQLDLRTPGAL